MLVALQSIVDEVELKIKSENNKDANEFLLKIFEVFEMYAEIKEEWQEMYKISRTCG